MRKIFAVIGVAWLFAIMTLIVGCGSGGGGSFPPDGIVAKGPVAGATVTYVGRGYTATTANGTYRCNYKFAVTTTGGTFVDVNGSVRLAPDMASPAGVCNVTPLTSLYYYADPETRLALEAKFGTLDDLSEVVLNEVTTENELIAKLNESLGEVMTQIKEGDGISFPVYSTYLGNLAEQVADLDFDDLTTSDIVDAIVAAGPAPVGINLGAVAQVADVTVDGVELPTVPPVNAPVSVAVNGANGTPYNASPTAVTFAVHPTENYTYTIDGFSANDRLIFDEGTAFSVQNVSYTDGIIDVIGSLDGKAVTVHLTNVAEGSDYHVTGITGFRNVFGSNALVAANSNSGGVAVSVVSSNSTPHNASAGNFVYNIHPTSEFTYNISGFASGDKLVFDSGTAVSLNNISGSDGIIDVFGSMDGKEVTVHLTGIAVASDGTIYGVESFNGIFGSGSLQVGSLQ